MYGNPTVAPGNVGVLIVSAPPVGTTVSVNVPDTVSAIVLESLIFTVNVLTPAVVGFPLMTQLFGANVRPTGRVPEVMLHRYGGVPPVTLIVAR